MPQQFFQKSSQISTKGTILKKPDLIKLQIEPVQPKQSSQKQSYLVNPVKNTNAECSQNVSSKIHSEDYEPWNSAEDEYGFDLGDCFTDHSTPKKRKMADKPENTIIAEKLDIIINRIGNLESSHNDFKYQVREALVKLQSQVNKLATKLDKYFVVKTVPTELNHLPLKSSDEYLKFVEYLNIPANYETTVIHFDFLDITHTTYCFLPFRKSL